MPPYKDHGKKSAVDNYVLISLCTCIGKFMEKVVILQVNVHLHDNGLLKQVQYGFIPGRSTLTSLLVTDAYVTVAW